MTEASQNRPTRNDHAAECYERYRAEYLETHSGAELPAWSDLGAGVQDRWITAIGPLHDAAVDRDAYREDCAELRRRLLKLADSDERATTRLRELEDAVAAARASLPDMVALMPLPAPFAEVIARLQRALDAARSDAGVRLAG